MIENTGKVYARIGGFAYMLMRVQQHKTHEVQEFLQKVTWMDWIWIGGPDPVMFAVRVDQAEAWTKLQVQ